MPTICAPMNSAAGDAIASSARVYRPKILHLINHFQMGGTERQAVLLLQNLDRARYDVHLSALSTAGPLFEEVRQLYPVVNEYPLTCFYNYNALKQAVRLRTFLIKHRIDILHTHEFYSGLLAIAAAQFTGTRVIASQRHLRMSDRAVHRFGRLVINALADRVLVNAEAIQRQILATTPRVAGKVVVIKNGLVIAGLERSPEEVARAQREARALLVKTLGIHDSPTIVGTVANLRPVKGHQYLIEAAARVIRACANVHFVLIGEGELRSALEKQVQGLGIEGRVHFLGHRTDARSLAAGFDLAVLASLHEGMPNMVLEAMAAGVPVIATAVGGVTEIITDGDTGYLVAPADPGAMAKCITFAVKHDELRKGMGWRGYRSVSREHGVDRMVASVQSLYDDLVNERNRRA